MGVLIRADELSGTKYEDPLGSSEPCRRPVCPHLNPQCSDSTGDKCYPRPTRIQQPRGPSSHPGLSLGSCTNGGPRRVGGQGYLKDVQCHTPQAQATMVPGHRLAFCTATRGQAHSDKLTHDSAPTSHDEDRIPRTLESGTPGTSAHQPALGFTGPGPGAPGSPRPPAQPLCVSRSPGGGWALARCGLWWTILRKEGPPHRGVMTQGCF